VGDEDGVALNAARLVGPLCGAALAVTRVLPIADPDYHWHLATGRFIAQHHTIPRVDAFSHTAAGRALKFVDWLADLVMYALHRAGGDALVTIAFAVVGGLAVALATERARRLVPSASPVALLAVALAVATVIGFRVTPRPQTFTFALAAALFLVLDRVAERPRSWVFAPLLIAFWQNTHSSALLGVAIVFAYAVSARTSRPLWLAALTSLAALFVAVRPIDRLAAGFDHLGDPRVSALFPEWGHPFVTGVFGAWVVAAIALLLLSLPSFRRFPGPALAVAGLAIVSFVGARFLPLLAIAAAPLALATISERSRLLEGALAIAAGVAASFHVHRPGVGLARGAFPERAAAFAKEHGLRGKLFNDFHFGGYLIWTGYYPVFVDGRSMALYGIEFVRDAVTATDGALDVLLDKYDVSIAIVPPDRRMGELQRKPGWALLSFDDVAAVLVRERDFPEAASLAYRVVHPGSWFELSALRADAARAELEALRAVSEAPDSSIAAVLAVSSALANHDLSRADALLADAERRFPGTHRVMRARLLRCIEGGDAKCACEEARAIEHAYPNNSYTAKTITALRCP